MSKEKKTTPKDSNTPARAIQRRKIDASVIDEMAQYVSVRHTEHEAALLCGIKPSTWYEFKSRNLARTTKWTERMLTYRAKIINHNLQGIQNGADGKGTKHPDWRANLALLKIQDPQRFGDAPSGDTPSQPTVLTVNLIMQSLEKMLPKPKPTLEITDASADTNKTQQ